MKHCPVCNNQLCRCRVIDPAPEVKVEPHKAVEFVKGGYRVEPGINGGFVVIKGNDRDGGYVREMAAFSNHADMLSWLKAGHEGSGPIYRVSYYR